MNSKPTILVVDDEEKILEIVQTYLEKSGYHAIVSKNGREALDAFETKNVSLILLDLMLPDSSGEEICKKIRETSDVPIIIMTAKVEENDIIDGLQMGADDYVTKPFSPRQLMARVAAALRRTNNKDMAIIRLGNVSIHTESRSVTKNDRALVLTPNEYALLLLFASCPHKVFTRDEIIARIKNDDFEGFDRSIDSHIKNLRHKVEDNPKSPRLIVTVYGVGYRLGGELDG